MPYKWKGKLFSFFLVLLFLLPVLTTIAGQATYTYDAYDRLIKVVYVNGPIVDYSYDENGNLISKVVRVSPELTVIKTGNGSGLVTSTPAGIDCGPDCINAYTEGTVVTLTATPDTGSAFTGWFGGGCSGTGDCVINLMTDSAVTAQFDNTPPSALDLTVISLSEVHLTWLDNSIDETGFKIERTTDPAWSTFDTFTVGANVTTHADTGLTQDTTYYYRVKATNSYSDSEPTAVASAQTSGYTITVTDSTYVHITPAGLQTIYYGNDFTFTIAPDQGYFMNSDLLVDGASVGRPNTYTFENVTSNHTIEAPQGLSVGVLVPIIDMILE